MSISETPRLDLLRRHLPPGWKLTEVPNREIPYVDRVLRLDAPADQAVEIRVRSGRQHVHPRRANKAVKELQHQLGHQGRAVIVEAPYVSPTARTILEEAGIGYLDETGNIRVWVDRPAILIAAQGADRNPTPPPSTQQQSLRGPAAGAIVRALIDHRPPYGVRQIAEVADVSPASVSRTLRLLQHEGLITRENDAWTELDWEATLRLWAQDYEPRLEWEERLLPTLGLPPFFQALRDHPGTWAVTGRTAVHPLARLAQLEEIAIYVEDAERFQKTFGLVPHSPSASSTGTIRLMQPRADFEFVLARAMREPADGGAGRRPPLQYVAYSQLAVDLLTGPGREPAEGEALLERMAHHEADWRASL